MHFAFDFNAHATSTSFWPPTRCQDPRPALPRLLATMRHPTRAALYGLLTGHAQQLAPRGHAVDTMNGKWERDIVLQLSVVQAVVWLPVQLVVFDARPSGRRRSGSRNSISRRRPENDRDYAFWTLFHACARRHWKVRGRDLHSARTGEHQTK